MRYTIAELKTMNNGRAVRVEAVKAELAAAEREREAVRQEMQRVFMDEKAYNREAAKEAELTAKINRLMDGVRQLSRPENSYTDKDVIEAWAKTVKPYNAEIAGMLADYRKAKRELFEKYISLAKKQDAMLSEMQECDNLLKEKPVTFSSPLRDMVSDFIPEYRRAEDAFFSDVRQAGDPEDIRLFQCGNGVFADVTAVSDSSVAMITAQIRAGM